MPDATLTAKQRKALAFRERKKGGTGKPPPRTPDDLPEVDVPGDGEDEDDAEGANDDQKKGKKADKGKGKAVDDGKAKKDGKGKGKENVEDGEAQTAEEEKKPVKSKKEVKQRFILFVGEHRRSTYGETASNRDPFPQAGYPTAPRRPP